MSPEYADPGDINEAAQASPPFRIITTDNSAEDAGYCAGGVCVVPEPDLGPSEQQ